MSNGPLYYKVTVSTVFTTADTYFTPGQVFWVTPDIYNSTLPDGSTFASKCITAQPQSTHP
jgi:hypothetical protein